MNTGICDPVFGRVVLKTCLIAASLTLGACSEGAGTGFSFASGGATEAAQTGPVIAKTTQTGLARGAIKLKAPKGYCIDKSSIKHGLNGSSAMLAACSALDGKGAGSNAAVMTVSVSPRRDAATIAPSVADLKRAVAPAQVLASQQKGALAMVQVSSGGDQILAPADPAYWRGATLLDTRLVMLSVFSPEGSALSGNKGAELLIALARGISATQGTFLGLGNTAPAEPEAAGTTTELAAPVKPVRDAASGDKKGVSNLIGRLFNRS